MDYTLYTLVIKYRYYANHTLTLLTLKNVITFSDGGCKCGFAMVNVSDSTNVAMGFDSLEYFFL